MHEQMPEEIRNQIWKSKLNAEFNYRCYDQIIENLNAWDICFKLALAITSSSTVVFWVFVEPSEILWKLLSAISAIIAVINVALNFQAKVEYSTREKASYFAIWNDFQKLWINLETQHFPPRQAIDEWHMYTSKIAETEKEKSLISPNKHIKKICAKKVLDNNKY